MTEAPAWAQGLDVAWLKEAATIFRAEFKPHSYGAFGLPKERDVADARANNNAAWTTADTGKLGAIALFRQLGINSVHEDFCGRKAHIMAGDLFIRAIAGDDVSKIRIINGLHQRHGCAAPVWVEGHVENLELVKLLGELGFRHVMTKISASSDLKGLWLLGDDPHGLRMPAPLSRVDEIGLSLPIAKFISPLERKVVLEEIGNLGDGAWAQHYSAYNKRQSWTSFALQGYDPADPQFIIKPSEMSKDWKTKNPERLKAECVETKAAPRFRGTLSILQRIPGKKQRVRLMRLGAGGGELTRHSDITDREAGTADGQIMRLHIPIETDPRCEFRSWTLDGRERRMHLPERSLTYLDTRKPHAVINPSDVERIHLVVDVHSSAELRRMIAP